ncbi:MAG TPA: glycosyltransferase, partial [Planctomycetota bacterium]|nr:glycosyltransferase [Planctomycetota bacterium]
MAFITGEYPKTSEVFILRELRELRRRGLDFVVVATRKLPDIPEAEGIDAEVLLRPRFFSLKSLAAEVRFCLTHPLRYLGLLAGLYRGHWRSLRETVQVLVNFPRALAVGYDLRRRGVTHVHALWANLPATLGWIIARGLGMTFSYSGHAWDLHVGGRMLREKTRLARRVVVCSAAAAGYLETVVGDRLARKVTLVHHGLDPDTLPERSPTPGDVVLAAGRFEPKKGFDVLIRACGILAGRGRKVRCVIIGDGPLRRKLARLVDDL